MNLYEGKRTESGAVVTVDGIPLEPHNDMRNHSPTGFEWGYCGSGPAQLALALLVDALDNDNLALEFYQDFKFHVVAGLARDQWEMTQLAIKQWIAAALDARAEGYRAEGKPPIII